MEADDEGNGWVHSRIKEEILVSWKYIVKFIHQTSRVERHFQSLTLNKPEKRLASDT